MSMAMGASKDKLRKMFDALKKMGPMAICFVVQGLFAFLVFGKSAQKLLSFVF